MSGELAGTETRIRQHNWRLRYGEWAVVTGASEGIGRALALALAKRSLSLVLVARRESLLNALADELRHTYAIQALPLAADLSQTTEVQRVVDETRHLQVGLLAASAGFGTSGKFMDTELDAELNMLDVNIRSVLMLVKHYGARFVEQRRGGIILLSSFFAFQGVPYSANYAATKAYVQSLAEGLRHELLPGGVDVLASAPGPTASGFAARAKMSPPPMSDTADEVAERTLNALGRQTTVRPGRVARMMGGGLSLLPRTLRTRILANVIGGLALPPPAHKPSAR